MLPKTKRKKGKEEMELKLKPYQTPTEIEFNFEEIKNWLSEKVSKYETLVYTDEQMQEAKKDKADLNKLSKALNDERIRLEKKYLEPFNIFKAQINDLRAMIDKPVKAIDVQVKEYEEHLKSEKEEKIREIFGNVDFPHYVLFEQIFDAKWLNKSVSLKSVVEAMENRKKDIDDTELMLKHLPEIGYEALEIYKRTLDLQKAVNEAKTMQEIAKKKAEEEVTVKSVTPTKETIEVEVEYNPQREWVNFSAYLSKEEAKALKDFFSNYGIEFKAI